MLTSQNKNPIENIEKALLNLLINTANTDETIFHYVYEKVSLKDFSNDFNSKLYDLISSLILKQNIKPDKSLILSKLRNAKSQALFEEVVKTESLIDNLNYYIDEIKNSSRLRNLKSVILDAQLKIQDNPEISATDLASSIENGLIEIVSTNKFDFYTPNDLIPSFLEKLKTHKSPFEIKTGFPTFDEKIGGIPNDFVIIAARPGMGKTELALHFAVQNALQGKRIAIFSLEMDEEMVLARMISNITEVPFDRIYKRTLDEYEFATIERMKEEIMNLPIHIEASPTLSASQILSKCKRLKIKYPDLSLIIVDYIQIISGNDEDTQEGGLAKISQTLRSTRRIVKTPLIALSQLSRACENRENKRPQLSDLRGSGSIEQDGALVLFLYSESYYDDSADPTKFEIIVAKNRHGETGTVIVTNNKEIQKFKE
jgi:replicative DNA helicase